MAKRRVREGGHEEQAWAREGLHGLVGGTIVAVEPRRGVYGKVAALVVKQGRVVISVTALSDEEGNGDGCFNLALDKVLEGADSSGAARSPEPKGRLTEQDREQALEASLRVQRTPQGGVLPPWCAERVSEFKHRMLSPSPLRSYNQTIRDAAIGRFEAEQTDGQCSRCPLERIAGQMLCAACMEQEGTK